MIININENNPKKIAIDNRLEENIYYNLNSEVK